MASAKDLKNKTVVITGGADGIGFEIANCCLLKQAKTVILLDINEELGFQAEKKLTDKESNCKVVFIKCDITKDLETVFKKILDSFTQVDILINNAGVFNEKAVRKTVEVNVTALIEWSQKFWEHMRRDKGGNGGTIMNLASIYGYRVDPFIPAYQASKFAVVGFTKSLGHEYNFKRTGVRVVALCPGFTETKLVAGPGGWDDLARSDFKEFLAGNAWQQVAVVGQAAVDVLQTADSGTVWLVEGARPLAQVLLSALCR